MIGMGLMLIGGVDDADDDGYEAAVTEAKRKMESSGGEKWGG